MVEDKFHAFTMAEPKMVAMTYEEILAEYRWYVKDPTAELPEEVMEQLRIHGKI